MASENQKWNGFIKVHSNFNRLKPQVIWKILNWAISSSNFCEKYKLAPFQGLLGHSFCKFNQGQILMGFRPKLFLKILITLRPKFLKKTW